MDPSDQTLAAHVLRLLADNGYTVEVVDDGYTATASTHAAGRSVSEAASGPSAAYKAVCALAEACGIELRD